MASKLFYGEPLDVDVPVVRTAGLEYPDGENKRYLAHSTGLRQPGPSPDYYHADYNCPHLSSSTKLHTIPLSVAHEYRGFGSYRPCPFCTVEGVDDGE